MKDWISWRRRKVVWGLETGVLWPCPVQTQLFIPQTSELKPLEDGDSPLRDHDHCTGLLTLTILLVSEGAQLLLMISASREKLPMKIDIFSICLSEYNI